MNTCVSNVFLAIEYFQQVSIAHVFREANNGVLLRSSFENSIFFVLFCFVEVRLSS